LIASTTHFTPAFRQGLREFGYVEGENITVAERSTQGQSARFPELVAEAIRMEVDVLVVSGSPLRLAARNATTTIPIVFLGVADPAARGSWRASRVRVPTSPYLARPGRGLCWEMARGAQGSGAKGFPGWGAVELNRIRASR
jgi:hypothetical protein